MLLLFFGDFVIIFPPGPTAEIPGLKKTDDIMDILGL